MRVIQYSKFDSLGAFKKKRFEPEKVDVCTITTQNLAKLKFKKKLMDRKKEREKRRSTLRGLKAAQKASQAAAKPKPKLRLDHRNYGAWYIKPEDWEKRFHRKTKKGALDQCLHKRELRHPEKVSGTKDSKTGISKSDFKKEETTQVTSPSETTEIDDEEISQVSHIFIVMCLLYIVHSYIS